MNRLTREQRASVIGALCEGLSVNATVRMTGVAKTSILRLLRDMGRVCLAHDDSKLRGLYIEEIEADELWAFNHCKAKVLPRAKAAPAMAGDVWTWFAIDRKSKTILSWIMGDRDESHAHAFMQDLASRLIGRPDLSTDGLGVYRDAVYDAFKGQVDYAQVHKVYQTIETAPGRQEAVCVGCEKRSVFGSPRIERSGTSRIERCNLSVRMGQRRWTRKTNAHSKKFENMEAAFALFACHYNWARPHMGLDGRTPAMALGLADRPWKVADLVGLLEADEQGKIGTDENKRGPYRPKNQGD